MSIEKIKIKIPDNLRAQIEAIFYNRMSIVESKSYDAKLGIPFTIELRTSDVIKITE